MGKSKTGVEDDLTDLQFLGDDDGDFEDFLMRPEELAGGDAERRLPARQRLELRNEQRSLREQLSDWEDYDGEDFLAGV